MASDNIVKKFRCIHCGKVILEYSLRKCKLSEINVKANYPLDISSFKERPNLKFVRCISVECAEVNQVDFGALLSELIREEKIAERIKNG